MFFLVLDPHWCSQQASPGQHRACQRRHAVWVEPNPGRSGSEGTALTTTPPRPLRSLLHHRPRQAQWSSFSGLPPLDEALGSDTRSEDESGRLDPVWPSSRQGRLSDALGCQRAVDQEEAAGLSWCQEVSPFVLHHERPGRGPAISTTGNISSNLNRSSL